MFRITGTRTLLRSFPRPSTSISTYSTTSITFRNPSSLRQSTRKRPSTFVAPCQPLPKIPALLYATIPQPPFDLADHKVEKAIGEQKIPADPKNVSSVSSVRHILEGKPPAQGAEDMMAGIKSDIITIKDTFSLNEVPRASLYLGAAGVLPYAATSLSTVYLAWDINHSHATGQSFLFSPETAHQLLETIFPIQIGFGAIIISFLGAIHWGLEYAGYGGYQSYRRYMYGVIAPAVAWPTLLMPVEYALITQFSTFTFMYFADARATVRGWCPPWYATYRFVLTFLVGASIIATLVGRGQIAFSDHGKLTSPVDYVKRDRDAQWLALEKEEKQRRKELAAKEEEDEEEAEEEEEEEEVEDEKDVKKEKSSKKDDKKDDQSSKKDEKKGEKKDEEKDKKDDGDKK
ncbi:hypothetical protein HYFRA_00006035 [Hymenoscyphus fraxineus]|uniref:Mitochondrial inner membrane protein 1 n=1 Tax=Hymenoscyphus fraxineus TaxID=746836 RepID=A0A9N9KX28_9HELO|nr:hypothetical protein HYFRA_00006035 [Hymenoscyphus fraxineus]